MGRSKRRGDGIRPRACGVQIYRIPISTKASGVAASAMLEMTLSST